MKNKTEKKLKFYKLKSAYKILKTVVAVILSIIGGIIFGIIFMPYYLASRIIRDIWEDDYESKEIID